MVRIGILQRVVWRQYNALKSVCNGSDKPNIIPNIGVMGSMGVAYIVYWLGVEKNVCARTNNGVSWNV